MSKRPFSYDPLTGITEWFEATDEGFNIISEQDVEPILELNKAKQNMGREYYAADPDMWKVASIPIMVQFQWLQKYGITDVTSKEHWPKVRKLLNDPDWRYLKTADIII
jgi:hypothetical protein